jgi:hypothetical protein
MAGIEAELDTERVNVEVDESFGDILRDLELGAMGIVDARWKRLVFVFDFVYVRVGDESDFLRQARLDTDLTQVVLDAKLGFRLVDRVAPWGDENVPDAPRLVFDVLAGTRYWYNNADIDVNRPTGPLGFGFGRKLDITKDWNDGIVGVRAGVGITPRINFSVMADIGGFDIANSSELTWMVMPSLNWRVSDRFSLHAGYKHLDVARERPSTNREFDFVMSGPFLGFGFHF